MYAFPADEHDIGVTLLVAKERDARMIMATVAPSKGTTGELAVRRLAAFLKELALEGRDMIIKSDQEEALKAVISDLPVGEPMRALSESIAQWGAQPAIEW